MKLFGTNPPMSADEFKARIERLEADAKEGLTQTREMHRQLILVRSGVAPLDDDS